jgi:hypothetical protein
MAIEFMTRSALPLFLMVTALSDVPPGFRFPQLTDVGLTDILGRIGVTSEFSGGPEMGNCCGHALPQVLKERNSDMTAQMISFILHPLYFSVIKPSIPGCHALWTTDRANPISTEDAAHLASGELVNRKETDRSEDDQDQTESSGLIHRAADIEVKNPYGHHFMAWNN